MAVNRGIRIVAPVMDGAILLVFAAVGRASHNEHASQPILATLGVAAPFLAGWYGAALLLGGYRPAIWNSVRRVVSRTAGIWLVGCAIGLGIRSGVEGRLVPATFAAIAFGFNLVLLCLWRALAALLQTRRP